MLILDACMQCITGNQYRHSFRKLIKEAKMIESIMGQSANILIKGLIMVVGVIFISVLLQLR
jgi:hypothetical protein